MNIDVKKRVFSRNLYVCEYDGCYKRATDLAHKVPQRFTEYVITYVWAKHKRMITKTEANKILNHPTNLAATCREHNDAISISNQPLLCNTIISKIYKELYDEK